MMMERPKQEGDWQSQLQVKLQVLNTPNHCLWYSGSIFYATLRIQVVRNGHQELSPHRSFLGLSLLHI